MDESITVAVVLRSLAQAQADELSQVAIQLVTVVELAFGGPLDLVVGGSGVLTIGVIWLLRMARDWSSDRRSGAAQATMAENAARRSTTHADLAEWLVDEAMQGRLHVAPTQLIDLVTRPELQAARDRPANKDVSLEPPPGTEADAGR